MLDVKLLRNDAELEIIKTKLETRGFKLDIAILKELESKRKNLQIETENLQRERNKISVEIGKEKARIQAINNLNNKSIKSTDINALENSGRLENFNKIMQDNKSSGLTDIFAPQKLEILNDTLKSKEKGLNEIQQQLQAFLATIPNLPHESTPIGFSEDDNKEIRRWGAIPNFDSTPKDHVALGVEGIDFEAATRITGARFVVLHDKFARLHRAIAQFMLDLHTQKHGYQEIYVPYLVSRHSLFGTGQLPKMEDDLFFIEDTDWGLIPTSEVAVTNLIRDQIIEANRLPLKYTCHSPCFRKEAGSYGKDMRGMLRQHQFDKVEMIQIVRPEDSYAALESMVSHAEAVLQALKLPYRVMALCTGDIGFSSAKTYDLDVWLPGQNRYREISSCSNTEAFQARRMQARFRHPETHKPEYVHTLNGSGLAVGRTLIAIVENYQTKEGKIQIPEVLWPYMGDIKII